MAVPAAKEGLCAGSTPAGNTAWKVYAGKWLYVDIDTSGCGFTDTPVYVTSLSGTTSHWKSKGSSEIYHARKDGFRIYLYLDVSPNTANQRKYAINWVAASDVRTTDGACHGKAADWVPYHSDMTQTVSTSDCGYTSQPVYVTSMTGNTHHWTSTGSSEVYNARPNQFTVYIDGSNPSDAKKKEYVTNFIAMDPSKSTPGACSGFSSADDWQYYSSSGIYVDLDLSKCGFRNTPVIVTSLHGTSSHWTSTGSSEIYNPTETGFRIYISTTSDIVSNKRYAKSNYNWFVEWIAVEKNCS
jgi:ribosomal protein S11